MTDLVPINGLLSFVQRPSCPMCGQERFNWKYVESEAHQRGYDCPNLTTFGSKPEGHLDLTCQLCGYTIGMETKFAKERRDRG